MTLPSPKLLKLSLLSALLLANVFIMERLISQQTWSLFDLRQNFLLSKRLLQMPVVGSDYFLRGREGIAQGQVHLHRWFGYQEIQTTGIHKLKEIRLSAALHKKGTLTVTWKSNDQIEGVRVSDNSSVFFRADSLGKWTYTKDLDFRLQKGKHVFSLAKLSALSRGHEIPEETIDLKLRFFRDTLEVFQGDHLKATISPVSNVGVVGIQGNDYPVTVDEIVITDQNGKITQENFEPPVSLSLFSGLAFAALLAGFILFRYKHAATFAYVSLLFLTVTWAADRYHFSNFELEHFGPHLNRDSKWEELLLKAERARFAFSWDYLRQDDFEQELNRFYPVKLFNRKKPILCKGSESCLEVLSPLDSFPNSPKLILVGTSQSAGAGALRLEDTFFVKLHQKLLKVKPGLQSLNISIPGSVPHVMREYLRHALVDFPADTILINLGHNGTPQSYKWAVEQIIRENPTRRIFLVNEASTDMEEKKEELSVFNERLASQYKVKVIPLYQFFRKHPSDKENVWWDNVHFNNLGHDLAGEFLFKEISRNFWPQALR